MGLVNVKFDGLGPTPFRWLKLGEWCQCRCRLRYVAAHTVQNYELWMIIVTETYGDEEESILQVALLWTQGVAKATMGFKRHM
ncbi:hypothetical protein AVEN_69280-1 [Araneus ventricosus]|uniref:Uncharacterized protein n=1 Tax=Araneus ventricosus TaxID=182803 RepID=A0A4Y2FQ65_ARAVE|nr:hypothetical protein AVEN_69280-1 [Araneus ventricosus]